MNAAGIDRTKSFANNAFWSLVLQLVVVISGFLVPHAIIETYGSETNGLVASLSQLVSYITLVEAGISAAAIFELYHPLSIWDLPAINVIISASKHFYYKSGIIFTILVAVLAVVYPLIIDCEGLNNFQVAVIVFSLGATGFLDFFTLAKYRVLLTASQRNWVIQIASIIYKILYVVVILVLATYRVDIEIVYLAAVVPILVRTLILIVYTKRKFPEIDFNADSKNYKLDQRWDAFYLQILGVVQSGFPILVVTFVMGDLTLVSIFSIYLLVANGVQSLCATITNGTQASFGDVIARKDQQTLQKTYYEMGTLMGIIDSAVCGVAAIMIVPFVSLYTEGITDINYVIPSLGVLMMTNVFLYHLKTPEGLLVVSGGKYRESRPYVTAQTLILIIGSIIGAFLGGMEGVVIGVCLSNIYAAIYLNFFIPNRVTNTSKLDTFKRYIVTIMAYLPAAVIACLQCIYASNWLVWIAECVVVAALACPFSLAVFCLFEKKSTFALIRRVKRLLPTNLK